jgi:hypothetical protein
MPCRSSGEVSRRTRMTLLARVGELFGLLGGEARRCPNGARRGVDALGEQLLVGVGVEARVQQLVELLGIDLEQRLLRVIRPS